MGFNNEMDNDEWNRTYKDMREQRDKAQATVKEQEQTIALLQVGKYGIRHLAEQNRVKDERIAELEEGLEGLEGLLRDIRDQVKGGFWKDALWHRLEAAVGHNVPKANGGE